MWKYWQVCFAPSDDPGGPPAGTPPVTPTTPPASTPPAEPPSAPAAQAKPWWQDRIDALTREKYELKAQLERTPPAAPVTQQNEKITADPAELAKLVNDRATQLLTENEFNKQCNDAYEVGSAAHTDFRQKLDMLNRVSGGVVSRPLVEAALETGQGAEVLYKLGSDPELAAEVVGLSPAKMAVRLAKLASDIEKPAGKPASRAPNPITPQVNGQKIIEKEIDDPTMSTAEWMAKRNKEVAERRKSRGY